MDVTSLRLFVRIAELGGVTKGARDLSMSAASASARLARLEQSVGFRLFNRTTRAVSLTTDGAAFLPYAQHTLETLDAGLGAISGRDEHAQGVLRMTMPGSFGRMHVIPLLAKFRQLHPGVYLDLRLSDEVLDVVEGAYDLVIRNAMLTDSNFVARKLAADHRLLVAAPSYLAHHGEPQSVPELSAHRCVVFPGRNRWKFADGQSIEPPRSAVVNDGEAMRHMIENGMGIGLKSLWNAADSLRAGKLVPVLAHCPVKTESAIWALYPDGQIVAPKVRAMIDFLIEQFAMVESWER
ncbi:MAG: LysR substrate-binding domain-containing protein [Pseudomonadota bacterium]